MDKKGVFILIILGLCIPIWITVAPIIEKAFGLTPAPVKVIEEPTDSSDKPTLPNTGTNTPNTNDTGTGNVTKISPVKPIVPTTPVDPMPTIEKFEPLPTVNLSLENKFFTMEIDPQKGIKEFTLLKYKNKIGDEVAMALGNKELPAFAIGGQAAKWNYSKPEIITTKSENDTITSLIVSRKVLNNGITLIQKWELDPKDHYIFNYTITFKNTGKEGVKYNDLRVNCGYINPVSGSQGVAAGYDQGIDVYSDGAKTYFFTDFHKKLLEANKFSRMEYAKEEPFKWIAVKNRYFVSIVELEGGWQGHTLGYADVSEKSGKDQKEKNTSFVVSEGLLPVVSLSPGQEKSFSMHCYVGPQELNRLKALGKNKDQVMQLGLFIFWKFAWLSFISGMLLKLLIFFESFCGSYGLSIILLTVLIKAVFWKMQHKSNQSMKKMQTVSPLMKEIRAKYKDQPQVLNQKIMELYREHGVNPMAGCLPIFLQMPIYIALFNSLRGSIELRQASFLWIDDLSKADAIFGLPIHPLAICWVILMVLQQRVMPSTATDPMQKKVMQFVPVLMGVFLYNMPSGLTLYWVFQSILTIIQYKSMNKQETIKQDNKQLAKK